MRYRLNEPIVANRRGPSNTAAVRVALPVGSILRIPADVPSRGLIDAEWDGQEVSVFVEDVRSRGTILEVADQS